MSRIQPSEIWTTLLGGTHGLTCICPEVRSLPLFLRTSMGVDNTFDATTYYKATHASLSTPVYAYGAPRAIIGDAKAIITNPATGKVLAWRSNNGANSKAYCGTLGSGDLSISYFLILLAEAILDGAVPKPPKKIKGAWDIDDCPDSTNTLADIQQLYALLEQYGIQTTWGLRLNKPVADGGTGEWDDIDADVKAFILSKQVANGGLIWPVQHNHDWHWDFAGGDTLELTTKLEFDTEFRGDNARAQASGFTMGTDSEGLNNYGYLYNPNNRFNAEALELVSPETSIVSSPENDTVQAGYGIRYVRIDGNVSSFAEPADINIYSSRGVRFIGASSSIADGETVEDSAAEIQLFAIANTNWLARTAYRLASHNLHGFLFYDGHDNGTNPGYRWLQAALPLVDRLKDVYQVVHPSNF